MKIEGKEDEDRQNADDVMQYEALMERLIRKAMDGRRVYESGAQFRKHRPFVRP